MALWGNFVWSDPRKTHWLLDNYKTKLTIITKLAIMTYQPPLSRIMALFCESIVCVTSKIQNNYFLLCCQYKVVLQNHSTWVYTVNIEV